MSLSNDGSRVAIGARYNDDGGTFSGHVRLYERDTSVTLGWRQLASDIEGEVGPPGSWFDKMGWSVSLSGDGSTLAAGAPGHNYSTGAVRVYELEESS